MQLPLILLVSADKTIQDFWAKFCEQKAVLLTLADVAQAAKTLLKEPLDWLVLDLDLEVADIQALADLVAKYKLSAGLIIIGSPKQIERNLFLLSENTTLLLSKPFNAKNVEKALNNLLNNKFLKNENQKLLRAVEVRNKLGDFLGKGNYYNLIISKIEEFCKNNDPVLISGEQGTEKDIIAAEIFEHSKNSLGPFLKKNINAEAALDDISFLYEANQGCLILEDIALLDREMQKKLKGVLQESSVNVRLILLASQPLDKKIENGEFDKELFRLISAQEINLMPLRDRIKDLPDILENYLTIINELHNFKITGFSDEALLAMSKYTWPGNILQLRSVVFALAFQKRAGEIILDDLPEIFLNSTEKDLAESLRKYYQKLPK